MASSSNLTVSLSEAATFISTCGDVNTLLLQGPPGVGKSDLLKTVGAAFPDAVTAYIDVGNLSLGDLAMPVIDHVKMVTNFAPNSRFQMGAGQDRPIILMLDELPKAPSKEVMNMLLPVMLEGRLGSTVMPRGSRVFGTGNNETDGVGDRFPAHAYNRVTQARLRVPTAQEWISDFAALNGIEGEVIKFADENPEIFQCYLDLPSDAKNANPYIFNPLTGQTRCFCSPRSLARASNIVKNRASLGDSFMSFLAGTIGEPAARLMEATIALGDSLVPTTDIVRSPESAALPKEVGTYFIMAYRLVAAAQPDNIEAIAKYVKRWTSFESTALFLRTLAGNKNKVGFSCRCRAITEMNAAVGKYF